MISVIIPAYNAAETIRRCLKSVLIQRAGTEIILADDGSEDETRKIAAEYGTGIRVLTLPHGGVSAARNAGLEAATGEWIMFLDADDELLPDALAGMEPCMTVEADAVCGMICRGNEKARTSGKAAAFSAGHELMDFVLADPTNYLTIHAWAFRRKEGMPLFDSALRIGEDSDWVLRYLSEVRKAVFVPVPVYRYTISAGSTIHKWRAGQGEDYLKMLAKLSQGAAGREHNWPLFVLTNYLLVLTHVIFHPGNPDSREEKLKAARRLREDPMIKSAFDGADLSTMSRAKRLVLLSLKYRLTLPAWLAVKLRQKQNRAFAKS